MPPRAIAKSFCTTREAADLLGVSVGTVQLWVERGLLEAWKTDGGHRRVVRESIERLLHKPASNAAVKASEAWPAEPRLGAGVWSDLPSVVTSPRSAAAATMESAWRLKVMVVEDDVPLLRLYQTQISRWPMKPELVTVDNGFSALLLLGRSSPDLLVLDLHMPEMDGFGMLRVIGNAPDLQNTRVVVVTGLDAEEVSARGGLPHNIEVLPKPIPFARLAAIAQEIVDAESSRQASAAA